MNLAMAVSIDAGAAHTCARLSNSNGRCWGSDSNGQLGSAANGMPASNVPVFVDNVVTAGGIDVGINHSCAVFADSKTAHCWGGSESGQLGDDSMNDSEVAVAVSNLTEVINVTAGGGFSCALVIAGTVHCWGANSFGQLGNGSTQPSGVPVEVSGLGNAMATAAGGAHACAVLDGGTLQCWGLNGVGQLGTGAAGGSRSSPVEVSTLTGVELVAAGSGHTCAVLSDGTVRCWGANESGQLGNGSFEGSATPVQVSGL
jgi:alpha-tubulin suppressor-like RCC1 family protein